MRFLGERLFQGKTFLQLEYDGGYRGGWFEKGTPMPEPSVRTDPNTFVFLGSKLRGQIFIKNSKIRANISSSYNKSQQVSKIIDSEIIDSSIDNEQNFFEALGAKISSCRISNMNVSIHNTEAERLFVFDEDDSFDGDVAITNSKISDFLVEIEGSSKLWMHKVTANGSDTKLHLKGYSIVNVEETIFSAIENCDIVATNLTLNIKKCKFRGKPNINVSSKTVNLSNSVFNGHLEIEGGNIADSMLNGYFCSESPVRIENCYFSKNNVVDIPVEGFERVLFRSSKFTGRSKILCNADAPGLCFEIDNTTIRNESVIKIENGHIRIVDSNIKNESMVKDSEVLCSIISGSAIVDSVNVKDSIIGGTAAIGYTINGEMCENGIRSNINGITVDSADDFVMLDVSDQEIVSFDRENGVNFYNGKHCEVLHVDVEQDVESFEEFAKNKNILPICFDTFSYFRKISDEVAKISHRNISEITYLFFLFAYANELHHIRSQATEKTKNQHFDLFDSTAYPYYEFPAYQPISAVELFKSKDKYPICDAIKKDAVFDIKNNNIVYVKSKIIPNFISNTMQTSLENFIII